VGDNPEHITTEAQFAALVGGDNATNAAIHHVSRLTPRDSTPDEKIRGATNSQRYDQKGNHALPETIRFPGALPSAHQPESGAPNHRTYAPHARTFTSPSETPQDTSPPGLALCPESNEDSAETTTSLAKSETGSTSKKPKTTIGN